MSFVVTGFMAHSIPYRRPRVNYGRRLSMWGAAILAARPSQETGQRKMIWKPTPLTWMAPAPETCPGRFAAV